MIPRLLSLRDLRSWDVLLASCGAPQRSRSEKPQRRLILTVQLLEEIPSIPNPTCGTIFKATCKVTRGFPANFQRTQYVYHDVATHIHVYILHTLPFHQTVFGTASISGSQQLYFFNPLRSLVMQSAAMGGLRGSFQAGSGPGLCE